MMNFDNCKIDRIVIHEIGNKYEGGALRLSASGFGVEDPDIHALLKNYFLSPFKKEASFRFAPVEDDLGNNIVRAAARSVFDGEAGIHEASVAIARHLFDQSNHPNIKAGELYVVHFRDCLVDDGPCDALGIFKSENKDTFLKIILNDDSYHVERESGINIKKMDKACLVFNVEPESGYRVSVLDRTNSSEALYWTTDFLNLLQRDDDYFQTSNYLKLCKDFVRDVYNQDNDVSKADQIDLLNRSLDYFKNADTFNESLFKEEVVGDPAVAGAFDEYKSYYQEQNEVSLHDQFDVSAGAVKDGKRYFRHVLKLDKNFHVYIHGQKKYIEKGYDPERDMNYYKLYFREEN